jgi:hypothetical protein
VRLLGIAFETALQALRSWGVFDPPREADLAKGGERDPERLCEEALKACQGAIISVPNPPPPPASPPRRLARRILHLEPVRWLDASYRPCRMASRLRPRLERHNCLLASPQVFHLDHTVGFLRLQEPRGLQRDIRTVTMGARNAIDRYLVLQRRGCLSSAPVLFCLTPYRFLAVPRHFECSSPKYAKFLGQGTFQPPT